MLGDIYPEYKQTVEQVAASNVVKSEGSEHLSPAQAQEAFINAQAEELMKRKGIDAIVDGKIRKTLYGGGATGVAIGGATAALLTRRKNQQQQNETGAAEIS